MVLPFDEWPDGVDVLLLPEEPDSGLPEELAGHSLHPSEQTDIRKALRAGGFTCEFKDKGERAELSRRSDAFWYGVILFTANALANGAGNLLADYVTTRFGGPRLGAARIHGRIIAVEADGVSIRVFESEGLSGEEWLEALDKFIDGTNGDS